MQSATHEEKLKDFPWAYEQYKSFLPSLYNPDYLKWKNRIDQSTMVNPLVPVGYHCPLRCCRDAI